MYQVGHCLRLYQDVRSTKHKFTSVFSFSFAWILLANCDSLGLTVLKVCFVVREFETHCVPVFEERIKIRFEVCVIQKSCSVAPCHDTRHLIAVDRITSKSNSFRFLGEPFYLLVLPIRSHYVLFYQYFLLNNTLRTGLLNCLNALSRGLTFRHRTSCI